jgi:hypothetical protein
MALPNMVSMTIGTLQFGQHDQGDVFVLVSMTTTTIASVATVVISEYLGTLP